VSADYKTNPLRVCASSTGGPAISVSATLIVNDSSSEDGRARLTRVDQQRQCANLTAHRKTGQAKIQLVFAVAPFIGNGEFTVAMELAHPALETGDLKFEVKGEVRDTPRKLQRTFDLP
jgi:hypothetical protein